jgi:hypothetical protein
MRFGAWNVRKLYGTGSHTVVARELARYKLALVGVQKLKWDKRGTEMAEDYTFYGKKSSIRNRFFLLTIE